MTPARLKHRLFRLSASTLVFLTATLCLGAAADDLPQTLRQRLGSSNWADRRSAFKELKEMPTSEAATQAMIGLMLHEDAVIRRDIPPEEGDPRGDDDGGWSQYISTLLNEIEAIAKREPDRQDIWRALALQEPDGSAMSRWLAGYGDRVTPYLLSDARAALRDGVDEWHRYLGGNAIVTLAQIVANEYGSSPARKITAAGVAEIKQIVLSAAGSTDDGLRAKAIEALGIEANSMKELTALERLAATDPRVDYNAGTSGKETRWFNREQARKAADQVRKRLGPPGSR
jgi:hypothetical protein